MGEDSNVLSLAQKAREAAASLREMSLEVRNRALKQIAVELELGRAEILEANRRDVDKARDEGLAAPLLQRLKLTEEKIRRMIDGLYAVSQLPDPLGTVSYAMELSPGMRLYRVGCPIGVIGVIFESRPDALVQISSLCLKSGNAVLLKGGREAMETNECLTALIARATQAAGAPEGWCALLHSREDVQEMLSLHTYIDLIIPRGSNEFVQYIMNHSQIPVLGHAEGLCHVYADDPCDLALAVKVTVDSKAQNLSVCNAAETLLVHRNIAPYFLPDAAKALEERGIELRGDESVRALIPCKAATPADWETEYLDAILSVKMVDSLEEAAAHINRYGSHHTDAILTTDPDHARRFMRLVDSADVFCNCSTRFADGFLFGFGAEVGIATGKLHARGPMGLEGLCTYKYQLYGSGQTLTELNNGAISLTHRAIDFSLPDLEARPVKKGGE